MQSCHCLLFHCSWSGLQRCKLQSWLCFFSMHWLKCLSHLHQFVFEVYPATVWNNLISFFILLFTLSSLLYIPEILPTELLSLTLNPGSVADQMVSQCGWSGKLLPGHRTRTDIEPVKMEKSHDKDGIQLNSIQFVYSRKEHGKEEENSNKTLHGKRDKNFVIFPPLQGNST